MIALLYVAPEIIRGEPYEYSADIYTLGMLMYHMLTGNEPMTLQEEADRLSPRAIVFHGARPNVTQLMRAKPEHASTADMMQKTLAEILQACWHENPAYRPTSQDIVMLLTRKKTSFRNL